MAWLIVFLIMGVVVLLVVAITNIKGALKYFASPKVPATIIGIESGRITRFKYRIQLSHNDVIIATAYARTPLLVPDISYLGKYVDVVYDHKKDKVLNSTTVFFNIFFGVSFFLLAVLWTAVIIVMCHV